MDYSVLARSYSTLQYENQLKKVLAPFCKNISLDGENKYSLHKRVNDALFENYQGEEILKFKLAQIFKNKDYVAAFEVKVKNSRADFLVINGDTKCFEVKSKLDTLRRLEKQAKDYKDVFEYNTVVIHHKHTRLVEQLIPEYYGIWYFNGRTKIEHRKATLSPHIDPASQLQLMSKRELRIYFGTSEVNTILMSFEAKTINKAVKEMLKNRYKMRWDFVKANWDKILPIDLQFFFNTNVSPTLIYST